MTDLAPRPVISRRTFESIDVQNQRERKLEDARDAAFGYATPRCPVCGGQRKNPLLEHVCEHCGAVTP